MTPHCAIAGPRDGPAVVLIGSLGTTLAMWAPQIATLSLDHHVVAVDLPGHGGTPVPAKPPTLVSYANDVVELLDTIGIRQFSVVGLSLGGAVAQVLAAVHPDRVKAAVIASAAPSYDAQFWRTRADTVRRDGLSAVLELTSQRRFSETFLSAHPDVAAASLRELATMDPAGYAACCEALASFTHPMAQQIAAPTLIIAGSDDVVTPPRLAREIALLVSSARLQVLPRAGHLVSLEQPQRFNDLIGSHLCSTGSRTNRG